MHLYVELNRDLFARAGSPCATSLGGALGCAVGAPRSVWCYLGTAGSTAGMGGHRESRKYVPKTNPLNPDADNYADIYALSTNVDPLGAERLAAMWGSNLNANPEKRPRNG